MKKFVIPAAFLLSSCQSYFPEKLECDKDLHLDHKIKIINEEKTPLTCSKAEYVNNKWELEEAFQVAPSSSKYLKMCSYDTRFACSIITKHERSTMLTYFTPYISGDYKVFLQDVPYKSCDGKSSTRKATIILLPSGERVGDKEY